MHIWCSIGKNNERLFIEVGAMCLTKYANLWDLYYVKYDGGLETVDFFNCKLCFIYLDMYVLTCEIDVWINTPIDNDTSVCVRAIILPGYVRSHMYIRHVDAQK